MTADARIPLKRLPELESLRGLMSLWVLVGHVLLTFDGSVVVWTVLTQNGRAVDIFMALSGFAIFFLLSQKASSYRDYIIPRFFRLFPAYILAFFVSVLLTPMSMAILKSIPDPSARNIGRMQILQGSLDHAWGHSLAHLTMLHGLVPDRLLPFSDYAFLGQAWSISLEWQFYLIAPIFFYLTRGPHLAFRVGAAIVLAALLHKSRVLFGQAYIGSHVAWFALGIGSFSLWQAQDRLPRWLARNSGWAVPAAAGGWVLIDPANWHGAIWILTFGMCLGHSACEHAGLPASVLTTALRRALLAPPLIWLGRISYSVYLTHMIVAFLALALLTNYAPAFATAPALLIITLIGTLAVSSVLYQVIERPFIDFAKNGCRSIWGYPIRSSVRSVTGFR